MSAIIETEPGGEIVCIGEFHGYPEGFPRREEERRAFRIGQRFRYAGFYRDETIKDNPVCWMIRFDAADGRRYAATQTYFVAVDEWDALKRYFARRLIREPKAKPLAQPQIPATNP